MATLRIKREEECKGLLGLTEANYQTLSIDFEEGSHLEFSYAVRKIPYQKTGWDGEEVWAHFTIDPTEFISAYEKKEKSTFGMIWHDYCADVPIRTADGKIFLCLHDFQEPTLQLSSSLAAQLISELKREFSSRMK